MRYLPAVLVAAALLTACGGTTPPGPPAGSLSPASGTQLTGADDGRSVAVRAGDEIQVALQAEPGWGPWQGVRSSDPAVLEPLESRGIAPPGATVARFRAGRAGRATISASAAKACSPGFACAALARAYTVTVTVSG